MRIEFYRTETEKEPFIEWENKLDIQTQAKIDGRLTRIEVTGNLGDFKSLGDGLFELRLDFGPGYRIYFGKIKNKIILLLLGGAKKSQSSDIKKAKNYWYDHQTKMSKK